MPVDIDPSVPAAVPPVTAPANCAELLLAYQGTIVHDLRGELNGLLLTIDFVRRQLGAQPQVNAAVGEALHDLDGMRGGLTRTLNQLDAVGHARRVIGGRDRPYPSEVNLTDVTADAAHAVADRARKRGVQVAPPPPGEVTLRFDPVMVQLAVHRLLFAVVETVKKADVRLAVARGEDGGATVTATVSDGAQVPADLLARPPLPPGPGNQPQHGLVALNLAAKLTEALGGGLTLAHAADGTAAIQLRWPAS